MESQNCYIEFKISDYEKFNDLKKVFELFKTAKNNQEPKSEKFDVVFVGHFEDDGRDEVFKYLIENGVNLKIFGPEKMGLRLVTKKIRLSLVNQEKILRGLSRYLLHQIFQLFIGFIDSFNIILFQLAVKGLHQFWIGFPIGIVYFVNRAVVQFHHLINDSHGLHFLAIEGLYEIDAVTDHLGR